MQFIIPLKPGWENVARRFPTDKLEKLLAPALTPARKHAREKQRIIEVIGGEFGLHHIHISDRAGLDLIISQNQYIGHNLNTDMFLEICPIIVYYLQLLDDFKSS